MSETLSVFEMIEVRIAPGAVAGADGGGGAKEREFARRLLAVSEEGRDQRARRDELAPSSATRSSSLRLR